MAKTTTAAPAKKAASRKPTAAQLKAAQKMGLVEPDAPKLTAPPAARSSMDFAVQQLSAPQAPATTAPSVTDTPEFKAALAAELAKLTAGKTAKEVKPRAEKVSQNGVTRPAAGTTCDRVWSAADEITKTLGGSPAPINLLKATLPDVNDHTVRTQYARWRAFNGVSGRVTVPAGAVEALQESEAAKAEAQAEEAHNRRASDKK